LLGALVNVASNTHYPNGRGNRFAKFTFDYLPIPEDREYIGRRSGIPTFRKIGFTRVITPSDHVHLDPEFKTFTYGHYSRYGETNVLLDLNNHGILFFYASLQTGENWAPYILGYFLNPRVIDCRKLKEEQIFAYRNNGFARNAHLKRSHPEVHLLIKGQTGSKRLKRAFPLTSEYWHSRYTPLSRPLRPIISELTGRRVTKGGWYRRTLRCTRANMLLSMIERWQERTSWPGLERPPR